MRKLTPDQFGLILMLIGAAIDSTAGLFTRLIYADNFATAAGRGASASLCLFIFLLVRERGRVIAPFAKLPAKGWIFALSNGLGMVLTILSLRYTSVANYFMIFATAPFVAGVLGWFVLREKLDLATGLAATAGLIGIAIMMAGKATADGLPGDLMATLVVLTYSINVMILRGSRNIDVMPMLVLTTAASALLSAPFADFGTVSAQDAGVLFFFGFIQIAIGNMFIFEAVKRIPPAQSGLLGVFCAALAPLMVLPLGEVPPPSTVLGGGIILAAAIAHMSYTLSRKASLQPAQ